LGRLAVKAIESILFAAGGIMLIVSPALAGSLPTPVPVAGLGLLALGGLGVGYRMLKRRLDR
jgi:hypothetical protein